MCPAWITWLSIISGNMNLRDLMTERILFEIDEDELISRFQLSESDLQDLTDLDFLEVYDSVFLVI